MVRVCAARSEWGECVRVSESEIKSVCERGGVRVRQILCIVKCKINCTISIRTWTFSSRQPCEEGELKNSKKFQKQKFQKSDFNFLCPTQLFK